MTPKLLFASAMMAAFSVSGPAFAASSVSNITSTLAASPTVSHGKCPAVITFEGTITVKGNIDPHAPVQIGYQFLRSDKATGPITYYNITAPGTRTVSHR